MYHVHNIDLHAFFALILHHTHSVTYFFAHFWHFSHFPRDIFFTRILHHFFHTNSAPFSHVPRHIFPRGIFFAYFSHLFCTILTFFAFFARHIFPSTFLTLVNARNGTHFPYIRDGPVNPDSVRFGVRGLPTACMRPQTRLLVFVDRKTRHGWICSARGIRPPRARASCPHLTGLCLGCKALLKNLEKMAFKKECRKSAKSLRKVQNECRILKADP